MCSARCLKQHWTKVKSGEDQPFQECAFCHQRRGCIQVSHRHPSCEDLRVLDTLPKVSTKEKTMLHRPLSGTSVQFPKVPNPSCRDVALGQELTTLRPPPDELPKAVQGSPVQEVQKGAL
eukprot:s194_g30.t1